MLIVRSELVSQRGQLTFMMRSKLAGQAWQRAQLMLMMRSEFGQLKLMVRSELGGQASQRGQLMIMMRS